MGLLSFFRAVFSLDTLDYRITADTSRSSSPPKTRASSLSGPSSAPGESAASRKIREESAPSRWKTPEFFFYYLVMGTVVPLMFKTAYDVSKGVLPVQRDWPGSP
jgi:hypothetical protein